MQFGDFRLTCFERAGRTNIIPYPFKTLLDANRFEITHKLAELKSIERHFQKCKQEKNLKSEAQLISVDALLPRVYDEAASGRLGDRGPALTGSRKVRTP